MKKIVIGLTGQTGAGKSTAADTMRRCGCAVIDADQIAREVVCTGTACLKMLVDAFGSEIINIDGSLNRKCLAVKAFSSRDNTELLNKITHPFILELAERRIDEAFNADYNMIVFDAPQLFESGGDKLCDVIVSVIAPEECRLSRIILRDNITRNQAMRRIKAQLSEEFFIERSDYVLDGGGEISRLEIQTESLIDLLKLSDHSVKEKKGRSCEEGF